MDLVEDEDAAPSPPLGRPKPPDIPLRLEPGPIPPEGVVGGRVVAGEVERVEDLPGEGGLSRLARTGEDWMNLRGSWRRDRTVSNTRRRYGRVPTPTVYSRA